MTRPNGADPERVFGYLADGLLGEALDEVRKGPLPDDDVGRHAAELLTRAVRTADGLSADDLERIVILGRSARLPISRSVEAGLVERLLSLLRDEPLRAVSIARFRPDLAACSSVIAQYGIPERRSLDAEGPSGERSVGVTSTGSTHGTVAAGRSIFRSPAERAFHEAACRVFPSHLVCPNVALHAALDWERLQGRLSSAERKTFFSALIDCVVFDPAQNFVPIYFFELDSGLHDDHHRSQKDSVKDRIVSIAGHRLVRIRPAEGTTSVQEFEQILHRIVVDQGHVY